MRDFTFTIYKKLLSELLAEEYEFLTFCDFIQTQDKNRKKTILRHDVDKKIENALEIAQIENEMGIKSSFYFRYSKAVFDPEIIEKISNLEHEIGYHYENLSVVARGKRQGASGQKEEERRQKIEYRRKNIEEKNNELKNHIYERAIEDFKNNLEKFRKLYPVKTISMHGSPLSRWDNRKLWEKYDYRDFGIIGEPYFDVDFDEVLYLTDTGRRWDGGRFNVRDKAQGERQEARGKIELKHPNTQNFTLKTEHSFHSTFDIIRAAEEGWLPDKMMINLHPQRWNDKFIPWVWELVSQNTKNLIKRYFFVGKSN